MILNIHLQNFTIIEQLDLDFKKGMTALTGATGAGKSIIIDAITLATGARLDGKVVRESSDPLKQPDRCDISVAFSIENNQAAYEWLENHELLADAECILRRLISKEGRSRAFINGHPVTLQLLSELGTLLVNIHGQHQHQYLLKKEKQLQLLDSYGRHNKFLKEIKAIYIQWKKTKSRHDEIETICQDQNNRREFLNYQIQEFKNLNLEKNELVQLEKDHKQLANADKLLNNTQQALISLSDNHATEQNPAGQSQRSITSLLNNVLQNLEAIKSIDPKINNAFEILNSASIQIQEADGELNEYLNSVELNPERLIIIEERLAAIHEMARKHHVNPKELLTRQEALIAELDNLNHSDAELERLQEELLQQQKNYLNIAEKLTQKRKTAATTLTKLIEKSMHQLGMTGGKISIQFQPHEQPNQRHQPNQHHQTDNQNLPNPLGAERIEFLVAANPGQSLQPLAKVASGGELSRISLAIQVHTAKVVQTPSLIFDEVDTGIGGGIAEIVGRLLRELGENTQIFSITHLPQVAALAHHHYQVKKFADEKNKSTTTQVVPLNQIERIEEIARMLGGVNITKQTRAHAEEMLGDVLVD